MLQGYYLNSGCELSMGGITKTRFMQGKLLVFDLISGVFIVCVCVAVKAEVISLIISSAFLYTSHLNLPSCTCLHFAPGEAEPPCGPGDRELHAVQGSYAQLGHNIKSAQRFWT